MQQLTVLASIASILGVIAVLSVSTYYDLQATTPPKLAVEVRQPITLTGSAKNIEYQHGWIEGEIVGECAFAFSQYAGTTDTATKKLSDAQYFKGELVETSEKTTFYLERFW